MSIRSLGLCLAIVFGIAISSWLVEAHPGVGGCKAVAAGTAGDVSVGTNCNVTVIDDAIGTSKIDANADVAAVGEVPIVDTGGADFVWAFPGSATARVNTLTILLLGTPAPPVAGSWGASPVLPISDNATTNPVITAGGYFKANLVNLDGNVTIVSNTCCAWPDVFNSTDSIEFCVGQGDGAGSGGSVATVIAGTCVSFTAADPAQTFTCKTNRPNVSFTGTDYALFSMANPATIVDTDGTAKTGASCSVQWISH